MKQRTRKQLEYYHADRLNYAVLGTPNRLEYDQGFFVKNGDGAADVKPIAHLYKTQVYRARRASRRARGNPPPAADDRHLVAGADRRRSSTSRCPIAQMDLCLYGLNNGVPAGRGRAAPPASRAEQVERVWRDIAAKRRATRYLHAAAAAGRAGARGLTSTPGGSRERHAQEDHLGGAGDDVLHRRPSRPEAALRRRRRHPHLPSRPAGARGRLPAERPPRDHAGFPRRRARQPARRRYRDRHPRRGPSPPRRARFRQALRRAHLRRRLPRQPRIRAADPQAPRRALHALRALDLRRRGMASCGGWRSKG